MRKGCWIVALCVIGASYCGAAFGQDAGNTARVCECGAHPPGPAKDRAVAPYAGEPADLSPYAKFATPYDLNYIHPNIYSGAGRDVPEPKDLTEVRIGFFGPVAPNPESVFGMRMLHGAQLAVEEANARGGYGGKPFKLMEHNDYDNWQAKTVYGDDRPTDPAIWGSASNEVVKMVYDDQDWAIFGSISSESTHIALRVALRAEIPIVNSASTDPTIPETYIPWYFTDLQDDRVQSLTLARHIYTELGLKRVALLRVNSRYGRFGVPKFRDASRRLGHPVVIEQKYLPGDTEFSKQLQVIESSRADAIVLWADEEQTAAILKQMRAAGMKQRVFGSYRTLGRELLAEAGDAAEGYEAVFPYDPTRHDRAWEEFNKRFEDRFQEEPEQFASLAFDAMNALLDSICKAGLNRARIHDALANIEQYDGVTGHMVFDPNQKNVAPMYLGTVHNGTISYRVATMEPPAVGQTALARQEVALTQQPAPAVEQAALARPEVSLTQQPPPAVGQTALARPEVSLTQQPPPAVGKTVLARPEVSLTQQPPPAVRQTVLARPEVSLTQQPPPAVRQTALARPLVSLTQQLSPAVGQTALARPEDSTVQKPYARVGEDGVGLAGPHGSDVPAGAVRVVLFGPNAAGIAQSPEALKVLAQGREHGRQWQLLPVESAQNWGAASTQLVHALMDEHALAIVALDRDASHLSEQLALKSFVPVVAVSGDKSLTSTNVPWIFRLPVDTTPAAVVSLLEAAEMRSGANAERLRDVLASGDELSGVAFLPGGEPRGQ